MDLNSLFEKHYNVLIVKHTLLNKYYEIRGHYFGHNHDKYVGITQDV